jgi:hypothetical protein
MLASTFHRNYTVSIGPNLIAGSSSGTSGFSNATGTDARFNAPRGIVRDGTGNAYIADQSNHSIRKVTPLGVVTTFAGTGSSGFVNGNGTSASFNNPVTLAIDANSNIYVADSSNSAIRKIDTGANVTTFPFAVSGPRMVSVSSDGSNALAIDSNYNMNGYIAGVDYGALSTTGNSFPRAVAVAVRPDGIFYYAPAPTAIQPGNPTNVPNLYRITIGSPVSQNSPAISSVSVTLISGSLYYVTLNMSTSWTAGTTGMTATISGFAAPPGDGDPDFTVYNGITATFTDTASYQQNWRFSYTSASTPPSGSYGASPNNSKLTTTTITNTYTFVTTDGTFYGNNYSNVFFVDTTQFYTAGQYGINGYSLSGDTATTNRTTQITSAGISNFIVKSVQGGEFFFTDTTSNQLVSYSNSY